MQFFLQHTFHVGRETLVEPKVRRICMSNYLVSIERMQIQKSVTDVTPLPNQECVSSWTTTSTKDLSPASKAVGTVMRYEAKRF